MFVYTQYLEFIGYSHSTYIHTHYIYIYVYCIIYIYIEHCLSLEIGIPLGIPKRSLASSVLAMSKCTVPVPGGASNCCSPLRAGWQKTRKRVVPVGTPQNTPPKTNRLL